jgi:ribosome-binding factor A
MGQSKAPSQRQLRVGELIRHELAGIFSRGEVYDNVIERAGVTVVEVQATPDLRMATVYVRPFVAGQGEALLVALEKNRRRIRGILTPKLKLKYMPDLRFKMDTALDYASHIDELLKDPKVARDLGSAADSSPGEE